MPKGLTAKQQAFIECYCNPMSKTFNNQLNSALAAGYARNTGLSACQNILDNHRVKQAMKAYKADLYSIQAITNEYIQQEHERLALLAELKGDLATATRNKELLGKTIAAYVEKHQIEAYPGRRPPDAVQDSKDRLKAFQDGQQGLSRPAQEPNTIEGHINSPSSTEGRQDKHKEDAPEGGAGECV